MRSLLVALLLCLTASAALAQPRLSRGVVYTDGTNSVKIDEGGAVLINGDTVAVKPEIADFASYVGLRTNTGDYAFQAGDEERIVIAGGSGTDAYDLPATAGTFATGDVLTLVVSGSYSGTLTLSGEPGVSVSPSSTTLDAANESAVIIVTGTDEYLVVQGGSSSGGGASQLTDLSDVGTATPTNRFYLVADGSVFKARNIADADIPSTIARDSELPTLDSLSVWGTEDPEAPSGAANLDRLYYIERTGGSIQPDSLFYWASADSLARIIVADTLAGADTLFYVASGGGGGSYTTVWYQDTFTNATASAILVASYTGTETKPAGAGSYAELTGTNFSVQPRDVLYNGDADDVVSLDMGEAFPSGGWRYRGDWYSSNGFGGGVGVCFGATSATLAGSGLCVQWEDNRFDVGTELDNFSTASDTPGAGELFIGAVDGQGPHEVEITFDPGGGATGDLTVTLYDTDDTTVLVTDTFTGLTIPSGQFFIMRMQQDREIETHTLYE